MDAEWIKSPTARRILMHWADSRPAWLWSHDGSTLLWRNPAARYFNSRVKKHGLKLSAEAVPIKGQVSRLIRLGSVGRSSLSRVQFLAGEKPVATTCSCTPLMLGEGEAALLLVGVDPIAADVLPAAGAVAADAMSEALFPPGTDYLLVAGGKAQGGSRQALATYAAGTDAQARAIRVKAGADDAELLFFPAAVGAPSIAGIRAEEDAGADEEHDLADMPEPLLPMGLPPAPEHDPRTLPPEDLVEPPPAEGERALSSLFDRLVEDAGLYTTLTAADEVFVAPAASEAAAEIKAEPAPEPQPPATPAETPDLIASLIEYADDPEAAPIGEQRSHWMITGRGFRALEPPTPVPEPETPPPPDVVPEPEAIATLDAAPDPETAERVSRYNFEELGRILTDRVSADGAATEPETPIAPRPAAPVGVINLNAETLVLNRLPLAILVFRDQQVLFANRALTDLLGHDSVESLRAAGIGSIFPAEATAGAGPVNRLVRRDGAPLPVTARLQSVSWQGRAALMLSANPAEPIRGHEGAVRAFAEIAAEARQDGFLVADRAGIVTQISGHGSVLLGRTETEIVGRPLAVLVGKADMEPLRQFLEKPARFAETARPSVVAASEDGNAQIVLFAEGQAGVVTGYFGFLSARARVAPAPAGDDELEPSMLGRLSRGVRRPLNTIIGFADLIRTAPPGSLDMDRIAEYAGDIRTAGLEIAVLVDELDDFTRLRDGRYAPRPSDVDLSALLESCMVRVKAQAGSARVLVRSAISERLPRIRADRASLGQALLNLLASAIDQTPIGGSVILSAQGQEDGGIAVHVRDGAQNGADLGERFVVFRDGVDKDGEQLAPVRSSVGLALTRSLLAVNACSLSVDPTIGTGTLFSLLIPPDLVAKG
ncbi:MAG: PAS domain-containing sensor histidine kinase [Devosia nanyangense]|uniref:histidine kinase n=1 Tax=Devosia nanyangense TaxID=1228055 RepID=A0A933L3E1_9HYPH|nr:PAS domain-containing sensor histidine kinase [Devosia nanyangense]